MQGVYSSDIPPSAEERVTEQYPSGSKREEVYTLQGEVVGVRLFFEDGRVELESPRRNGLRNGTEYQWDDSGQLRSAIPYLSGLEHGTARQSGCDGAELGRYEMRHGTGIDLWRAQRPDGYAYLSEVRFLVSGERHGFEWFIAEDQVSVYRESRFAAGVEHGIFREWDNQTGLASGFPRFYLLGRKVSREEYEYGRVIDPALPAYEQRDDLPTRQFPPAVIPHLTPPSH